MLILWQAAHRQQHQLMTMMGKIEHHLHSSDLRRLQSHSKKQAAITSYTLPYYVKTSLIISHLNIPSFLSLCFSQPSPTERDMFALLPSSSVAVSVEYSIKLVNQTQILLHFTLATNLVRNCKLFMRIHQDHFGLRLWTTSVDNWDWQFFVTPDCVY